MDQHKLKAQNKKYCDFCHKEIPTKPHFHRLEIEEEGEPKKIYHPQCGLIVMRSETFWMVGKWLL